MLSQDIKVPVIGTNFVKDIVWPVPLIEHLLNHVLVSIKPKTNRAFVRLRSCVTIDFKLHLIGTVGARIEGPIDIYPEMIFTVLGARLSNSPIAAADCFRGGV